MKRDSSVSGPRPRHVTVDAGNAGQRIDNFLKLELKGVPVARIYRGLRKGEVRVNKGRVRQSYKLQVGDQVRIPPIRVAERPAPPATPRGALAVLDEALLFEGDDYLVLDKPSGWAVHGGSGRHYGVIEALRELRVGARFLELCHRLDKDTSGCLVVAKKRPFLTRFHAELRAGRVRKRYVALVGGAFRPARQTIRTPLSKQVLRSGERMVEVDPHGKASVTVARAVDGNRIATLVDVELQTGRTHQIRVHLASVGHPIAGDGKYGDMDLNRRCRGWGLSRLFLHAGGIEFRLGAERHSHTAQLPPELTGVLRVLGLEASGTR